MNTSDTVGPIVEVRDHHGVPCLFIQGAPHSALMYYGPIGHGHGQKWHGEMRGAGIRLVSAPVNVKPMPDDPDTFDMSALDALFEAAVRTDPDVWVLPRVSISASEAWLAEHADDHMRHLNTGTGELYGGPGSSYLSFTSEAWRAHSVRGIRAVVRHAEERWGDHVLGYHLNAGDCGEWSYSWHGDGVSDFSKPQVHAFRAWLRQRYENDETRLREAWHAPNAGFETAAVPRDRTRARKGSPIYDPATDRHQVDYMTFHSEVVADTILLFCSEAKAELRDMQRQKLCAVFYGYYFCDIGYRIGFHNSGHHAFDKVLASDDVEVICGPFTYQERFPGGLCHSQPVEGSIQLRGKLLYSEEDTRTHLAKPTAGFGRCNTPAETKGVLRRNFAWTATRGTTQWWMDLTGEGWFSDPDILADLADMVRIDQATLETQRGSAAEVALIVSEESTRYERFDDALTDSWIARQLSELSAMGTPFDTFHASDLAALFGSDKGNAYRLVIFVNCPHVTPDQREAIRDHVAKDERTLLWVHAAGLLTDEEISPAAMAELTGIRVAISDMHWPLQVVAHLTGERVAYGTDQFLGPWLYADDPDVTVHGRVRGWTVKPEYWAPGLVAKDMDGWQSVWSAAPNVPAVLLQALARQAGVHLYTATGHMVCAGSGLLALHAGHPGCHTVRLARPATVTDAVTGDVVSEAATEFSVSMERGDTALWRLDA